MQDLRFRQLSFVNCEIPDLRFRQLSFRQLRVTGFVKAGFGDLFRHEVSRVFRVNETPQLILGETAGFVPALRVTGLRFRSLFGLLPPIRVPDPYPLQVGVCGMDGG